MFFYPFRTENKDKCMSLDNMGLSETGNLTGFT